MRCCPRETYVAIQPLPWSFIALAAAFFSYGLWPALKPEHFREACLRYTRPRLRPFTAPTEVIRVFGIIFVLICGFIVVLGLVSRLS